MNQEIYEEYEKVKDKISEEDFLKDFEALKEEYKEMEFMDDMAVARMVVGKYVDEKVEAVSESFEGVVKKISAFEVGNHDIQVVGRVMSISNPKLFNSKKGEGFLCNVQLADDTDKIRVVLWTDHVKKNILNRDEEKNVKEGDIVLLTNLECREGYRDDREFHMTPRSKMKVIDETNEYYPENIGSFPVFTESFTDIKDIVPNDEEVSILGRVIRIPSIRSYESNGKKGKVTSLEIQDATGKISYTLWNKDVKLINVLHLEEGDMVKILNEPSRERNGEISLSHWNGRIAKIDPEDDRYDVPEFKEEIFKIENAGEVKDVTLLGIVTKVFDTITFERQDGSEGYVKSLEINDDTGSIRITLWGDDTKLDISKGDILKIIGGNIEFDDYASTGYRVNTNWNTEIIINPDDDSDLVAVLKEYAEQLRPMQIGELQEPDIIDDDGIEVDIMGRLITLSGKREFQREDGSKGVVCSGSIADETGPIRVSFWDEKANFKFKIGDAYKIEDARTRMGMYAVELNAGKSTRILPLTEEEAIYLPSYETLEEMIYESKNIDELDEDDNNVKIIARVLDVQEPRKFQRQDGGSGWVGNMDIGDETGSIRATLWDVEKIPYSIGDAVKIQNPNVRYNNGRLELSVGGGANILNPSPKELEALPDIEELQNILYVSKEIEALEEDDTNIRVKGTFVDVYGGRILVPKCPHCNNTLEEDENQEFVCDYCGETVEEPRYLLMIPGKLMDDNEDEIQITFFNKLAEELLEMSLDEVIEIIEDSADMGALEGKVGNLEGLTLEVIADVNFNEFNEEIRLNPKKIISKEY